MGAVSRRSRSAAKARQARISSAVSSGKSLTISSTAMPEARLAREAQMCYGLIALASDYDCWRPHDPSKGKHALLQEILGNLEAATQHCMSLIEAVLKSSEALVCDSCDCRKSLELAVWTQDPARDPRQQSDLAPLFE